MALAALHFLREEEAKRWREVVPFISGTEWSLAGVDVRHQ